MKNIKIVFTAAVICALFGGVQAKVKDEALKVKSGPKFGRLLSHPQQFVAMEKLRRKLTPEARADMANFVGEVQKVCDNDVDAELACFRETIFALDSDRAAVDKRLKALKKELKDKQPAEIKAEKKALVKELFAQKVLLDTKISALKDKVDNESKYREDRQTKELGEVMDLAVGVAVGAALFTAIFFIAPVVMIAIILTPLAIVAAI